MTSFIFELKRVLSIFVLPPLFPLLLITLGLLLLNRHRRLGLYTAWSGVILSALVIFPASVNWLLQGLESDPPLNMELAANAQAIVIIGAGTRSYAPEFGGSTINRLALERLRYGAHLAKETGLPILVSGGAPTSDKPESEMMQASLKADFSTPARWLETTSRDTRENARFSAPILQAAGVNTILLVTHAAHMSRAKEEFEAQGLQVIPAPTAWFSHPGHNDTVGFELPSGISAFAGWVAAHEWLGLIVYRLSRD